MEGLGGQLPFFIAMIAIFYFFMIAPQRKQAKQVKKFDSELKRGDNVITKSGMHGKIFELTDHACVIETQAGKIKFERSAISMEMSKKLNAPAVVKK